MATWALALGAVLLIAVACALFFLWLKVFNGPDGERYQKLRMQGPFVPLSEAEVEADSEGTWSGNVQEKPGEAQRSVEHTPATGRGDG